MGTNPVFLTLGLYISVLEFIIRILSLENIFSVCNTGPGLGNILRLENFLPWPPLNFFYPFLFFLYPQTFLMRQSQKSTLSVN